MGSVQDGAIPEALASTALGSMRARYADLLANLNELSTNLGANHPQMRAARSQLEGMRQSIEQELGRIRNRMDDQRDIDRAKLLLMERRKLGETEAFHLLRKTAMDRKQRIGDIARQLIAVAEAL